MRQRSLGLLLALVWLITPFGQAASEGIRSTVSLGAGGVEIYPLYQGHHTQAGEVVSFTVGLGSQLPPDPWIRDTLDLIVNSVWPVSLYAADGVTPLTDTDADTLPDTGQVSPYDALNVVAKVTTPVAGWLVGASNVASVTVISSLDTGLSATAFLQTAIPAPFAQVYFGYYYSPYPRRAYLEHELYLARPIGQATHQLATRGTGVAITEAPDGNFIYAWIETRTPDPYSSVTLGELYYAILNPFGEIVRPATRLTDFTGATHAMLVNAVALAVAPNGAIGILWNLNQSRDASQFTREYNNNTYFASLEADGELLFGPTDLTNNAAWSALAYSPASLLQITATGNNRFVLAWMEYGPIATLQYAVRDTAGSQVKASTMLTMKEGVPFPNFLGSPSLTKLANDRALLTFSQDWEIRFAVLDSSGNVVKGITDLTTDGATVWDTMPDAAQLSDGTILVAWSGQSPSSYSRIRYATLTAAYDLRSGPTSLANPANPTGDEAVSVTADTAAHAILTWTDYHFALVEGRHLYYALLDSDGSVVTEPMIFKTAMGYLLTNVGGYGNTTYSSSISRGVDAWIETESLNPAPPDGTGQVPVRYGNNGLTTATRTTIIATLDSRTTYVGDSSGISPVVVGERVSWRIPDLELLDQGSFQLRVDLPPASIGATFPLTLTIGTNGIDSAPGDNTVVGNLWTALSTFFPRVMR